MITVVSFVALIVFVVGLFGSLFFGPEWVAQACAAGTLLSALAFVASTARARPW